MLKNIILSMILTMSILSPVASAKALEVYGTDKDFAKESIYLVITDRFVDGDKSNNYINQGGKNSTWMREIKSKDSKKSAYLGYMGGDFKGLYENSNYIKDMGFSAIWITPIVDNPNQVFMGGKKAHFKTEPLTDGGKSGYHGYWGVNFFKEDEHLISKGFSFKEFTHKMHKNNLKVVLDIVCNHGSPSYTMPDYSKDSDFGKLYDRAGKLVADHQNLHPSKLNHKNPLHKFYNKKPGLAELSDLNENNPEVLDYFTKAYLQWIEQGADAFRIDTYGWMPHSFWKKLSDRIRAKHPEFFMVGEVWSYDPKHLAKYQLPENGDITIFDFYAQGAMIDVFQKNSPLGYRDLIKSLDLKQNIYTNPYELVTFYDNHDMPRFSGNKNSYIDIHNWLFTSRGIPCVFYGSEIGFQSSEEECSGSRNYYGKKNIKTASTNRIYQGLKKIAHIRKNSIALQKGVQINLDFNKDNASFLRVYQKDGINQTALVLLNKSDKCKTIKVEKYLSSGKWKIAGTNSTIEVQNHIKRTLPPHSVEVLLWDKAITNPYLLKVLAKQ